MFPIETFEAPSMTVHSSGQSEFYHKAIISMGERNTIVSAYTLYRHLQKYWSHPSMCQECCPVYSRSILCNTIFNPLPCMPIFWALSIQQQIKMSKILTNMDTIF